METNNITRKFRLPRKVKKKLKGTFWLYPADEDGNSLMAFPTRSQEDYTAVKKGMVRNLMDTRNAKAKRRAFREKIDKVNTVSDTELKHYIDAIFREDIRTSAYNTLRAAKNDPNAITAYYNFVNAWQLCDSGEESYGNICCLALESAEKLLKKSRKKRR